MAQAYVPNGQQLQGAAQFFDRLAQADLPAPIRMPIRDSLTVLLEDDGETALPSIASFMALLAFLGQHQDLVAPAIGVNRDTLFVAVWHEPGFRLALEFPPDGKIHWLLTEFPGGTPFVRDGWATSETVPLPPRRQRATA